MDSQDYLEIRIGVNSEDTGEIVVAETADLGFDAFAYEDGVQKCYIQSTSFDRDAFAKSIAAVEEMTGLELAWTCEAMPKVNWNESWEQSGFTPIECGSFVVTPYGDGVPAGGLEPIFLNPQMAFGTGHHHTTFMMMQTMQELRGQIAGASVMDLGCGTAVLAILAAKLGAAEVKGIDIDATAVRSAEENVRLNGLDLSIICGDAGNLESDSYDFLLANIHRNIIMSDLPAYSASVKKGGFLLISGFYEEDATDILAEARRCGFEVNSSPSVKAHDGWCCITLEKN